MFWVYVLENSKGKFYPNHFELWLSADVRLELRIGMIYTVTTFLGAPCTNASRLPIT